MSDTNSTLTELETYLRMLDRAGFAYSGECRDGRVMIFVGQTDGGIGYSGFAAIHVFEQSTGKLLAVGATED